eukprot:46323-Eustigmatos_ZCMA.PRE.1
MNSAAAPAANAASTLTSQPPTTPPPTLPLCASRICPRRRFCAGNTQSTGASTPRAPRARHSHQPLP